MKIFVKVLKDIQLEPNGHVYTRRCSRVVYDSKNPVNKSCTRLSTNRATATAALATAAPT